MKIKRLEISGFKSFAEKTFLDFQQNVTGVVGPNGCGKSNIVDAIRWCMGEQSAKNLRGKAMEDVIFAGSETRKPLGVAEVSLIFSTEDGRAPSKYLDYAEIQLTRRLYRDGESDYLINKIPCRLLDITELFMDTGVGTRAYSTIEQGKIGQILHSRPEERRFLIEEAAGVTKFKSRKQLALKKIEGTRQNLARLTDLLGEIRRQLTSLQRQAKKTEKFREYRDELRKIEMLFTATEYSKTLHERDVSEQELAKLNEQMLEVSAASVIRETKVEETRIRLLEAEKLLTIAQEDIFRVRSDFRTTGNALEFQRKELAALDTRLTRLVAESSELETRLDECNKQQELLEMKRDNSFVDVSEMQIDLELADKSLVAQQFAEEKLNKNLESLRSEFFTALGEAAQFKSRFENAEKRLLALKERMERHSHEGMWLVERREKLLATAVALEKQVATVQMEYEELQVHISSLSINEEELKTRLPNIEKTWQSRRDDLSKVSSRLYSLKELEAQFTGFGQGTRTLMNDADLRSRFSGVLADVIQAPPELEMVLEAVLTEQLQCLLCPDDLDAVMALEFLKARKGGRVGIALPLNYLSAARSPVTGATFLTDMIQTTGPFSGLILNLLATVLMVEDVTSALRLTREYPDLIFVTRSGDMVVQGGIITGGSPEQLEVGLIHKKREIRELELAVVSLEGEISILGKQRDNLRHRTEEVTDNLKSAGDQLHQSEIKLSGLLKDRQQALDEYNQIIQRLEVQTVEANSLNEEQAILESELKFSAEQKDIAVDLSKRLEVEITFLQVELDSCRKLSAAFREKVTAMRVQIATIKEQHDACLRALAELFGRTEDVMRRLVINREEIASGENRREQLQMEISAATKRLDVLLMEQVKSEEQLTIFRARFEETGVVLNLLETELKKLREEINAIRQSQTELNLRFSMLTMQTEHLEQAIQERIRISMAEAVARLEATEFDQAVEGLRQVELQRLLDEIGEVNLMAIDECTVIEERFTFLTGQKEDLEESLRTLQQAIQRINRTTRQRFQETYNMVNAKFQEIFPRLFCGGKAELRLTDEEDLLETGIDIIVQPPGKKLQNVTLLSGGEKALTAVALIFSIFLVKPTPFCLLDEVDAPLDDANIGRFNEMVREMSSISQFIIITHNKATMQVADTLYGITMEEPGASRVVSVRLH